MISGFLQKLMFVKQFGIGGGKIEIMGENYVMLDAISLFEIQKIDETKLYEIMKGTAFDNLSKTVEYAKVYKNVKDISIENIAKLGTKMGQSDEGIVTTLTDLFNTYGLGKLEIINLDNIKKQANLRLQESTIAKEYLKRYKKAKAPVDIIAAGILAGIFSFIFKKKVDCVETKCIALKEEFCEFSVA